MNTVEQQYKRTWRAVILAAIAVAELIVCMLLFIPQSEILANARRQAVLVDKQVAEIEQAPKIIQEIEAQVREAGNALEQLNLLSEDAPEQVLMGAVSKALKSTGVKLTEFSPDRKSARGEGTPAVLWQLRCRGTFSKLMSLLGEIQKQGVLLHSDGFTLSAGADGDIDLNVVLGVWTEKAFRSAAASGAKR